MLQGITIRNPVGPDCVRYGVIPAGATQWHLNVLVLVMLTDGKGALLCMPGW